MIPRRQIASRQQGLVAVLLVALLVLGGVLLTFSWVSTGSVRVDRERATLEALARAKDALIAYAVSHVDNVPVAGAPARPGQLPCPDVNDDGQEDYVTATDTCSSLTGRLPWITLGLADLRDDSGERLWYVVSADFRQDRRTGGVAVPLNSDTAYRAGNASLTLAGTTPVANLVAIVIAPGAVLKRSDGRMQARGCGAVCNPMDFLDIAAAVDNGDANTSFVAAARSDTFNDTLLPVFSDDIMHLVQRRAASELATRLRNHYDQWQAAALVNGAKGFYPYAVDLDAADPSVAQVGTNNETAGMLPLATTPLVWSNFSSACFTESAGTVLRCQALCAVILGVPVCLPSYPSGQVANVATRFVDPPQPANFQFVGLDLGGAANWTLNPAQRRLDFNYSGFLVAGVLDIRVTAPGASSWLGTSWVTANNWHQNAYYALSSGYAISGANSCGGAGPACITIANTTVPANKQAVVVMTGRALASAGQNQRPVAPIPVALTQLLENANAGGTTTFEANMRTATFNDYPVAVRP